MVIAVGGHVYSLPTHSAIVPDLAVFFRLVVAFFKSSVFYLLDVGHFKLQETQRVLNEVGKRYPSQVLKALLQQVINVF